MIKGIFFDVGGTICTNVGGGKPSFKKILVDFTGKVVSDFSVQKQGYLWKSCNDKKELLTRLCKEQGIENVDILYEKLNNISYNVKLYEDVIPVLEDLSKNYFLGLLSNTTSWTDFDHHRLGIAKYINTSVLSCRVGLAKPEIAIFEYAQKISDLDAKELVYVGDTVEYDIKPALQAGWGAVLLNRKGEKNQLVPTISTLLDLKEILLKKE